MSVNTRPSVPLSRPAIVAVSLDIVDRDGLSALTMRRVARELEAGTMSLYHYVSGKAGLEDLVLDSVMEAICLPPPELPLADWLFKAGCALREGLLAHPHVVPLVVARSLGTPAQLGPAESMASALLAAGMEQSRVMGVVNVIGQYVFGITAMQVAQELSGPDQRQTDPSLITGERFPGLWQAAQAAPMGGFEADFHAGLKALARGLVE